MSDKTASQTDLRKDILRVVAAALAEDQARADVTSRLLFKGKRIVTARIISKQSGVVSGIAAAIAVFKSLDSRCAIQTHLDDGARLSPGKKILSVRGDLAKILAGERSALNILQRLSGIATLTSAYAERVKGTRAKIYDTRKTTPGLRALEKYAVRCGGGQNHRMSLQGAAMVKDNHLKALFDAHIRAPEAAKAAIRGLKARLPKNTQLFIEATTPQEINLALNARADVIMLDNLTVPRIKNAVKQIRAYSNSNLSTDHSSEAGRGRYRPLIEVTGGVTLDNLNAIARCGVDRISVGRLTHSAPALNISLDIE